MFPESMTHCMTKCNSFLQSYIILATSKSGLLLFTALEIAEKSVDWHMTNATAFETDGYLNTRDSTMLSLSRGNIECPGEAVGWTSFGNGRGSVTPCALAPSTTASIVWSNSS